MEQLHATLLPGTDYLESSFAGIELGLLCCLNMALSSALLGDEDQQHTVFHLPWDWGELFFFVFSFPFCLAREVTSGALFPVQGSLVDERRDISKLSWVQWRVAKVIMRLSVLRLWVWRRECSLGCVVFVEKKEPDAVQACVVTGWAVVATSCSKESSDSIGVSGGWKGLIIEVFKYWNGFLFKWGILVQGVHAKNSLDLISFCFSYAKTKILKTKNEGAVTYFRPSRCLSVISVWDSNLNDSESMQNDVLIQSYL